MISFFKCVLCLVPLVAKNKDYNYETMFLLQSTITCSHVHMCANFNKHSQVQRTWEHMGAVNMGANHAFGW